MTDALYQIEVQVSPRFLPAQSEIEQSRFAFAYTVTITNHGELPVQLLTRHWIITDGDGKTQEVRGEGVIGEQPTLAPNEQFTYTSGTLMTSQVGNMHGSYRMQASDGHQFDAVIPPFLLAVPGALH